MHNTIVVDLDGTLANLDHRLFLIRGRKKYWGKFYSLVGNDTANLWCVHLMRAMKMAGYTTIIVSARPQSCIDDTVAWLQRCDAPHDFLYLLRKNEEDFTPDTELKRNWLRGFGKDRILFTVDDRQRVVDMWREEGVTCLQCNQWKEVETSSRKLPLSELAIERGYYLDSVSFVRPNVQGITPFISPNAEEKARNFLLRKKKIGDTK